MARLQLLQRKAFLTVCIGALFIISRVESFVHAQKKTHLPHLGNCQSSNNNNRKKTMCLFSSTKKDESSSETQAASSSSSANDDNKQGFKVQTWNPFRLAVLRLGMTEFPATSPFNYGKYNGEFTCAYCGNVLFDSNSKYDSGSGWPSFWRSADSASIDYLMELDGRLECRCQKCKSHLGHVFLDGPGPASVDQSVLEASPASDPRGKTGRYLVR